MKDESVRSFSYLIEWSSYLFERIFNYLDEGIRITLQLFTPSTLSYIWSIGSRFLSLFLQQFYVYLSVPTLSGFLYRYILSSRVSKTNVSFVFAYFFIMCAIGKFATDYCNRELKKPSEEVRLIKIAIRDLVTL